MNEKHPEAACLHLLAVIVGHETGSKALKVARQAGMTGGTIVPAHGTGGHRHNKWFDDEDIRKEMVLLISRQEVVEQAIDQLNQTLRLNKPNQGIAFTLSIANLLGSAHCVMQGGPLPEGASETMFQAIFVVVEKGEAETAVQAAEAAGARGATVINARGAGVHETSKLFSMEIEPEKEMVLIIARRETVEAISRAVVEAVQLDVPGKGILFVVDLEQVQGFA